MFCRAQDFFKKSSTSATPLMASTWDANPINYAMMWPDIAVAAVVAFVGVAVIADSMLINGRAFGSICTGMGSDHMILENFIKPAVARTIGKSHNLYCKFQVVSGCASHLDYRTCACCVSLINHHFQKNVAWPGPGHGLAMAWPCPGQAMAKWRLRRSEWRGPGVPRVPGPWGP